jgi:tRNA modification GTPase
MQEGLHKIASDDETIVAISTPIGHSGIGVIRVSGTHCWNIAALCFQPHLQNASLTHRAALIGMWTDSTNQPLDEVVLTFFAKPHSYTGEDVLEISAHGNPFVMRRIVESVCAAGARLARAGEFTLRAVANGKMDLVQAEAVREFILIQTEQQAKIVLRQMEGSLSKYLRPMKEALMDVIARLEAGIDFAEDDVDVPSNRKILSTIIQIREDVCKLLESFTYGKLVTQGLKLAILGKANVGKSSLFNCLLARDRAIVSDIPGTTRDVITETISLDGIPLYLADTAGIRNTTDIVENIGMTRTWEGLADADFALVVLDGSAPMTSDDRRVLDHVSRIPQLIAINKSDLPQVIDLKDLNGVDRVSVSAKTGMGVENLRAALRAFLLSQKTNLNDDLILTTVRQHEVIRSATESLSSSERALMSGVPHEMVLLDLYRALSELNELTGEVVTDDILQRIFSTFCIGK